MHSRFQATAVALCLWLATYFAASASASADPAPFDLTGPTIEARVTRGSAELPIAEVPNLAPGDRIWVKADLPDSQSARYLLVLAFLRGSTNPPPAAWFHRCDTWTRECAAHGMTITVPPGAQQVLLFLAPKTGGDFRTLVGAVRGRPGAFVRASQDLDQAMLDRSRLESYLAAVRELNDSDPAQLKRAAPLLGRSLAIKVDAKCLDRIPELQAPCLMEGRDALILTDGHSTSIVEALTATGGPEADLAMEASYTPQLRYGYYSPYIASVLDIARILGSFDTAQYQYIPALTTQAKDSLALTLNTPPSFHEPMSVLVAALPAVERAQLPPLHAVDPKEIYCARKSSLVLPVEGAPLVFSTGYAHDMVLSLSRPGAKAIELPVHADAQQGGFVVDTSGLDGSQLGNSLRASLEGRWGFEKYAGPTFELTNVPSAAWTLDATEGDALIVGRDDTVHLRAASISCVDGIMLKDPAGKELKVEWKSVKPGEVEVKLPLKSAQPGSMALLVEQYGAKEPDAVALHAFTEAGRLDRFTLYAGDADGVLRGSRLDEVARLELEGVAFDPGKLTSAAGADELMLHARSAQAAAALKSGDGGNAKVTLKDGRVFLLKASVEAPRPSVALIGKSVEPSASRADSHIELAGEDELPQDARLAFSVRARTPASFDRDESIEIATSDESFATTLSLANGGMTLEDAKVAVATLDPAKAFGSSAFGPLKFRVVAGGAAGDWQPLATLVRLPALRAVKCPATPELACKLTGANLFLVDAIASDASFRHAVQVPDGFPGYALPVPHPAEGRLYVRLRDDPVVINLAALDIEQLPPSSEEAARAATRHAAVVEDDQTVARPARDRSRGGDARPASRDDGGAAQPPVAGTGQIPGRAAPAKD
ncbi:MAG TPA: hypothetical protein VGI35_05900 [Steroidobacteraceae bacterium]|jgi:hypothetical protein